MEPVSLLIGGIIGFLIALALTERRPQSNVTVNLQHNIGNDDPPGDDDPADYWKRGEEPPEYQA